jgi:hypothetical protein
MKNRTSLEDHETAKSTLSLCWNGVDDLTADDNNPAFVLPAKGVCKFLTSDCCVATSPPLAKRSTHSFGLDSRRRSLKFTPSIDATNAHALKLASELLRKSAARSAVRRLCVKKILERLSAWAQEMRRLDF